MKHASPDEKKREIDVLISKLDALEAGAPDEYQKKITGALLAIAKGQAHLAGEFEHLKKAIDLLTVELFKAQQKNRL